MRPDVRVRRFKLRANEFFDHNGHLVHRRSEGLTKRRNKGSFLQDPWKKTASRLSPEDENRWGSIFFRQEILKGVSSLTAKERSYGWKVSKRMFAQMMDRRST